MAAVEPASTVTLSIAECLPNAAEGSEPDSEPDSASLSTAQNSGVETNSTSTCATPRAVTLGESFDLECYMQLLGKEAHDRMEATVQEHEQAIAKVLEEQKMRAEQSEAAAMAAVASGMDRIRCLEEENRSFIQEVDRLKKILEPIEKHFGFEQQLCQMNWRSQVAPAGFTSQEACREMAGICTGSEAVSKDGYATPAASSPTITPHTSTSIFESSASSRPSFDALPGSCSWGPSAPPDSTWGATGMPLHLDALLQAAHLPMLPPAVKVCPMSPSPSTQTTPKRTPGVAFPKPKAPASSSLPAECLACGSDDPGTGKFCQQCGAKRELSQAADRDRAMTCPSAPDAPDAKKCASTGTRTPQGRRLSANSVTSASRAAWSLLGSPNMSKSPMMKSMKSPTRTPLSHPGMSVPPSPSFVICEDGGSLFTFTIRLADGIHMGLKTEYTVPCGKYLKVVEIKPGGAVEAWNRQCIGGPSAGKAVQIGDRISGVNAAVLPQLMIQECRTKKLLKISVRRIDDDDFDHFEEVGGEKVIEEIDGPRTDEGSWAAALETFLPSPFPLPAVVGETADFGMTPDTGVQMPQSPYLNWAASAPPVSPWALQLPPPAHVVPNMPNMAAVFGGNVFEDLKAAMLAPQQAAAPGLPPGLEPPGLEPVSNAAKADETAMLSLLACIASATGPAAATAPVVDSVSSSAAPVRKEDVKRVKSII
eukprot:TRINITY_DN10322_c0_g1_i4.p1 TRINITY_DN10322_c0_g1~~TRINITY_DN10322_c0_g1_i4.p1  ORF type:complete len:707 (+),score=146.04 TRINITY_DN10322_c0_g1_i4:90-2210(+)